MDSQWYRCWQTSSSSCRYIKMALEPSSWMEELPRSWWTLSPELKVGLDTLPMNVVPILSATLLRNYCFGTLWIQFLNSLLYSHVPARRDEQITKRSRYRNNSGVTEVWRAASLNFSERNNRWLLYRWHNRHDVITLTYKFLEFSCTAVTAGRGRFWTGIDRDLAMGTGSCPGVKRPGRGVNHPPPPNAEVKERLELYLWAAG
jgi:hypothetical protein